MSVKITTVPRNNKFSTLYFKDLDIGDYFIYKDTMSQNWITSAIYRKQKQEICVNLITGISCSLGELAEVRKIDNIWISFDIINPE